MQELLVMTCPKGAPFLDSYAPTTTHAHNWIACRYTPKSAPDEQQLRQQARTLALQGVSIGIRPFRYELKAIFFDLDATLIVEESIDKLAEAWGCADAVAALTEQAMAGHIAFKDALITRVAMLRGMPLSQVIAIADQLTLQPGALALARQCQKAGVRLFIASGGFTPMVGRVAALLGAEAYHANTFAIEAGHLSGTLAQAIVDGPAKARFVAAMRKQHAWHKEQLVAVGDGANDRGMMGEVGLGVGFNPKGVLYDYVQAVNLTGDHLFLQDFLFGAF